MKKILFGILVTLTFISTGTIQAKAIENNNQISTYKDVKGDTKLWMDVYIKDYLTYQKKNGKLIGF